MATREDLDRIAVEAEQNAEAVAQLFDQGMIDSSRTEVEAVKIDALQVRATIELAKAFSDPSDPTPIPVRVAGSDAA